MNEISKFFTGVSFLVSNSLMLFLEGSYDRSCFGALHSACLLLARLSRAAARFLAFV